MKEDMMKKSNKNKVYEAYNEIIDWFDAHRNKELLMEKFYLDKVKHYFYLNQDFVASIRIEELEN